MLLSASSLQWLASLAWVAYFIAISVWIVLQKRPPLSTLAWIFGLAALPVIGFVVYFFLGPQRIRRQRLRRQRLRHLHQLRLPIERPRTDSLSVRQRQIARLIHGGTGTPVSDAARIDLLVGGGVATDAIVLAINAATEHVHLEYYIFEPDQTGTRIRDVLIERARSGVAIRVLLDAVGSSRVGRSFLAPLRQAGAVVVWFHPLRLATLRPLLNLRLHRKIVVIDGRLAFTGGINITDAEDERLTPNAYQDLHLRIEGAGAGWLQAVFAEDWLYAARRPLNERELYPELPTGAVAMQVVASGPDSESEHIHSVYVQAIAEARRRVWLVTPYFVPGEAALMALKSAALRGVDVRLLVPLQSDSRVVTWAARSYFEELIEVGVRIYEFGPRMLHSKALMVDAEFALVGTANFDHRSFRLNFEVAVAIHDSGFAARLGQQFRRDFKHAQRVQAGARQGLANRLLEACARLLSPLL